MRLIDADNTEIFSTKILLSTEVVHVTKSQDAVLEILAKATDLRMHRVLSQPSFLYKKNIV